MVPPFATNPGFDENDDSVTIDDLVAPGSVWLPELDRTAQPFDFYALNLTHSSTGTLISRIGRDYIHPLIPLLTIEDLTLSEPLISPTSQYNSVSSAPTLTTDDITSYIKLYQGIISGAHKSVRGFQAEFAGSCVQEFTQHMDHSWTWEARVKTLEQLVDKISNLNIESSTDSSSQSYEYLLGAISSIQKRAINKVENAYHLISNKVSVLEGLNSLSDRINQMQSAIPKYKTIAYRRRIVQEVDDLATEMQVSQNPLGFLSLQTDTFRSWYGESTPGGAATLDFYNAAVQEKIHSSGLFANLLVNSNSDLGDGVVQIHTSVNTSQKPYSSVIPITTPGSLIPPKNIVEGPTYASQVPYPEVCANEEVYVAAFDSSPVILSPSKPSRLRKFTVAGATTVAVTVAAFLLSGTGHSEALVTHEPNCHGLPTRSQLGDGFLIDSLVGGSIGRGVFYCDQGLENNFYTGPVIDETQFIPIEAGVAWNN